MSEDDRDGIFSGEDEFGGFETDFGDLDGDNMSELAADEEDGAGDEEGSNVGNCEADKVAENESEVAKPVQAKKTRLRKTAIKPTTAVQKIVKEMMRKAGDDELPNLSHLMRDKEGMRVSVSDIALFTEPPVDDALSAIAKKIPNRNIVNLSAELERKRIVLIGTEILKAGRMYQPIQVADIVENGKPTGNLQCTSGRHRLAFIALAYGSNANIPVYVENMTLNEARDAVVVANQARRTQTLEKAEHAVLGAVGGNADAEQKAIYDATATNKTGARKYCLYSVFEKGYPSKLEFSISTTPSRKGGGLTTVSNIESFWKLALTWTKDMSWKEFDSSLKGSIVFLNGVVSSMQKEEAFDPAQHLSTMTLSAIGKWYRAYVDMVGSPNPDAVAKAVVGMGDIGRQKSDATYQALTEMMRS
jgi:hypothetical protein